MARCTQARYYSVTQTWTPDNHARQRQRRDAHFYCTAPAHSADLVHAAIQACDNGNGDWLWSQLTPADIIPDDEESCHAISYDHTGEFHWTIRPALTEEELRAKNAEPYDPPNQRPARPKKPRATPPPVEPCLPPDGSLF